MKSIYICVVACLGASLTTPGFAATYYVDPVAGSDANPGTLALPKATIAGITAMSDPALQPGDTVILRGTGHYPASHFSAPRWSGSATQPITVQSYPGERAVFDPGHKQFKTAPNDVWTACTPQLCPPSVGFGMPAHPDEYVSKGEFPNPTKFGSFLGSGERLLTYDRIEDLRAENESGVLVGIADPRPGAPLWGDASRKYLWTYRGPGLWWNKDTKRIHFRASPTHYNQRGVVDYTGPSDPRLLALSISTEGSMAARIDASNIVFKDIVFQNSGNVPTVSIYNNNSAVLDHCIINAGRYGVSLSNTRSVKLQHCEIDSHLPSYASRLDTKNRWYIDEAGQQTTIHGTRITSQMQVTSDGASQDFEIAHCEFRNAHDSLQLYDLRSRVHHSLFENINDEVFSFQLGNSDGVQVHDNLIRKALATFAFAQEGAVPGRRYIYRNVLDNRIPTLGSRTFAPDVPAAGETALWRAATDFKMNSPVDEFYFYQNTIIQGSPDYVRESSVFDTAETSNKKARRFVNNIHMTIMGDKPLHGLPDPSYPALSDGNVWYRRVNNPSSPMYVEAATGITYADYPSFSAGAWAQRFLSASGRAWDAHSQFVDPQFVDVAEYVPLFSVAFFNSDYRLTSGSPARDAGVDLTSSGWPDSVGPDSTPDVGALPYGVEALIVGVDGRHRFPDGRTPVAKAGAPITLADVDKDGFASVTLEDAGSEDPDGSISSYSWSVAGAPIASGASASAVLPVGDHQMLLTVRDNEGRAATDARQITVTGFDNLVRNPSFENGSAGWSIENASSAVTTAYPRFGTSALQVQGLAGVNAVVTQRVAVTPGAQVALSGWLAGVDFTGAYHYSKLSLRWLDAGGNQLAGLEGVATFNTAYTLRPRTAIVPVGAVTAEVILIVSRDSNPAVAYFDDIYLAVVDNKLQNGHFERGLSGWVIDSSARVSSDPNLARSREGALVLTGDALAPHYIAQHVPVSPGATYKVSGWIKTEQLPANAAKLLIQWTDANNAVIRTAFTGEVGETAGQYVQVTADLTVPADARIAKMKVIPRIDAGTAGGKAYFDDLYVR